MGNRVAGTAVLGDPVAPSRRSDADLIHAHRRGDHEALGHLLTRHQPSVRALCLRYVADGATADDMVQDTFHSVLRHLPRVDPTETIRPWILAIAANLCRDELRRRTRWLRIVDPGDERLEIAARSLPDRDRSAQPEAALEIATTRALVHDIAGRLAPRQRAALLMREIERLPQARIAEALDTTIAAVSTLLVRARERFRDELLRSEPAPGSGWVTVAQHRVA